jgi:type IV pilus assembly protein PilN
MANINLLPWREELREERKREFTVALVGVIIIAAGLLFVADRHVNGLIADQNARNRYLVSQIAVLDARLGEIRELRTQRAQLTERMRVIQDLQGNRPVIVRLFDELVRTLPEGVYYNSVVRNDNIIQLEGVAESNTRVSTLMRQLEDSPWFADPDLRQVSAVAGTPSGTGSARNQFQLVVTVTTPALTETGDD